MNYRFKGALVLSLVLILFQLPSCKQPEIYRELRQMMSKEIVIPASLKKVQADTVFTCPLDARAKCILYMDSTECSSCKISHLPRYGDMYALSMRDPSFDFLVVISPKSEERDRVLRQLQLTMVFPVYLDEGSHFLSLNPDIPRDNRFYCFLTDADGKVIFVGDPTWGSKTNARFLNALEKIKN